MKKNVGPSDKIIRYIIAIVLIVLYYTGILTGLWANIALVAAAVLILTGLFSFCAVYAIFGMNTCKVSDTGR